MKFELKTENQNRIKALNFIADYLEKNTKEILEANIEDYIRAEKKGISKALLSRLKLSNEKLNSGIEGVRKVGDLADPVNQVLIKRELSKGLILERKTVPIGVLGVIFESRPDAVMQISSLAIRSGNGVILKGGSEANLTNTSIVNFIASFLLGILVALNVINNQILLLFYTGFLGSFSTFSSFIKQLFFLFKKRKFLRLFFHYIEVIIFSFLFFYLGYFLVQFF